VKNIKQYELAIEIARQGSISKASQYLQISQPTLSKYLQKLEAELGFEIFDRSTYPLKTTAVGEKYLEAGKKIIDISYNLKKELDEIKNNKNSIVRLGISPSRAPYLLPKLIAGYSEKNPEGRIVVRERNTSQLNGDLLNGNLDITISLLNDSTKAFAYESLFFEKVLLAVPANNVDLDAITVLKTKPVISVGSGLRMWKALNLVLNEAGGEPPKIECQSIEAALSLVRAGFGATLVPSYIRDYGENKNLRFKLLPEEYYKKFHGELERRVCIFYRRETILSSADKAFIEACKTALKAD